MNQDTKDTLRIGLTVLLFLSSCAAFYLSLFWGWASGAGTLQPSLKIWSNIALGASFVMFWSSIGIWVVPALLKKKRRKSDTPDDLTTAQ